MKKSFDIIVIEIYITELIYDNSDFFDKLYNTNHKHFSNVLYLIIKNIDNESDFKQTSPGSVFWVIDHIAHFRMSY